MKLWARWFRVVPDSVWWTVAGVFVGFCIFWVAGQPRGVWVCREPHSPSATFISYHWSWFGCGRCVVMRERPQSPEAALFRESSRLDCRQLQRRLEADGLRCVPEGSGGKRF